MAKLTPMMQQYFDIKKEYKHCILMFRLGDFYEMFYDDALVASRELEIVLTGRECGQEQRAPMCGVPAHSVDGYIARLVAKGYKVAICEQVENPKGLKTIVKREVTRVVTPGTVTDPQMLDESKNSFIMCIYSDKSGFGMAVADVTTGEFLTASMKKDEEKKLYDEIAKFMPREVIINSGFSGAAHIGAFFNIKPALYEEWAFNQMNAYFALCKHFKVQNLNGYGIGENTHCISACGALIEYLNDTQKNSLGHVSAIKCYALDNIMVLDISSRRNLELTESIREKGKKGSLLWVLDRTKTAFGARLLRRWIEQPILDIEGIIRRHEAVAELKNDLILREELRGILAAIYDIERLIGKLSYQTANGRDMRGMQTSFEVLPIIKTLLADCGSPLLSEIARSFDDLSDLCAMIGAAVNEEPPAGIREGGIIKDGYNDELDRLRDIKNNASQWLMEFETRERDASGIKNLKVRFNKIFGYCIEITNSYRDMAPAHYIRRQTLSNCERYTTPELKEIEDEILGADERITELEYELFSALRAGISAHIERIQLTASMVAAIDVLQSFADVADRNNYSRPAVDDSGITDIKNGRHPVVEQMTQHAFVPNDTYLDVEANRLSIITGPNMAGKSTYMRQTALIVLMAQIGSFIPADSARVGIVDRIFTRVGASDDLATGQSTFMVEMSEVANILHNAGKNSLLILDEIGRGTSTFDGLSIAWSVLEHIAHKIGAKTLFATHYHELTELEGRIDGVKNYCAAVHDDGGEIVFLRKIVRGGADQSYGIYVARLAGVPLGVLTRADEILAALNKADIAKLKATPHDDKELFYRKKVPAANRLFMNQIADLDIDSLTPREALKQLYEIQVKAKELKDND
ncbi:MAG: DNA mismatch repair protein MutS [Defluviitaleaceae bacterium]|nr:DNA mismatch repair protein MutS [Defluviitaleaceae bacterium]